MSTWLAIGRRTAFAAIAGITVVSAGWFAWNQYQEHQLFNKKSSSPLRRGSKRSHQLEEEELFEDSRDTKRKRLDEEEGERDTHGKPGKNQLSADGTCESNESDEAICEKSADAASLNSPPESDGDEEQDDDDPLAPFQDVIKATDFYKLVSIATRERLDTITDPKVRGTLNCTIDLNPKFGSYNLAYILTFSDGVKRVARIPGHGHRFTELDREKFEIEYRTMQYIKQNTTIPLPEVFGWDDDASEIGTVYALISFVHGRPLNEVWHPVFTEEKRLAVLTDVARYMAQLHSLKFDRIGMLRFDEDGEIRDVGPHIHLQSNDEVAWAQSFVSGPYSNCKEELFDGWDIGEDCTKRARSCSPILELAVESIPDYLVPEGRCAISPHDLNYQNVFVDDDGQVTGFIDWDGVSTAPTSAGCGRYPSWLTRDWDPSMYAYFVTGPAAEDFVEESSPEELSRYRQHYAQAFLTYAKDLPGYDARMTRLSHILEAINIAVCDRFCRSGIVSTLLRHAFGKDQPFNLCDYADAYMEDNTEKMDAQIREAFSKMWHAEWEEVEA